MRNTKFSALELQSSKPSGPSERRPIREMQEGFPEPRPAYTTVQTMVYRLDRRTRLRRCGSRNAHIFEATVGPDVARAGSSMTSSASLADARSRWWHNSPRLESCRSTISENSNGSSVSAIDNSAPTRRSK